GRAGGAHLLLRRVGVAAGIPRPRHRGALLRGTGGACPAAGPVRENLLLRGGAAGRPSTPAGGLPAAGWVLAAARLSEAVRPEDHLRLAGPGRDRRVAQAHGLLDEVAVMSRVHIAAAQYPIGYFDRFEQFAAKLSDWVERGVEAGAQLLVFPEYAAMELPSLFETEVQRTLTTQRKTLKDMRPDFREIHQTLARRHGVHILAGSFPLREEAGRYRNRAHLFATSEALGHLDKCIMTRLENEQWGISPGA